MKYQRQAKMEKEKNFMIMVNFSSKVNIIMGKDGMEQYMIKKEKKNLK